MIEVFVKNSSPKTGTVRKLLFQYLVDINFRVTKDVLHEELAMKPIAIVFKVLLH